MPQLLSGAQHPREVRIRALSLFDLNSPCGATQAWSWPHVEAPVQPLLPVTPPGKGGGQEGPHLTLKTCFFFL